MLKRFKTITVITAILLVPALVFSAEKFAPANAVLGADNTVTIPLEIANEDGLMAIDIPLKFSEGVTLKEVNFENTRVEDFDLKIANINNEDNIVIIGLVHQTTSTTKSTLKGGEGPVANLVFTIDDPSIEEINLEAVELTRPAHRLMLVYNRRSDPDRLAHDRTELDFKGVSVSLSGASALGSDLPTTYALEQNYPNPFNPSTQISFALPVASHVELEVFNVLGQRVTTLVNGDMPVGVHTVTWDGRNDDGSTVSSGVYFYRVAADNFVATKKMMMLK